MARPGSPRQSRYLSVSRSIDELTDQEKELIVGGGDLTGEPLFFEQFNTPLGAHSLRQLSYSQTKCMDVRNSSGEYQTINYNTETKFVDTASLYTHLGGSTGSVSKMYNSNTAIQPLTQSDENLQPEISMTNETSIPKISFGANTYFTSDPLLGLTRLDFYIHFNTDKISDTANTFDTKYVILKASTANRYSLIARRLQLNTNLHSGFASGSLPEPELYVDKVNKGIDTSTTRADIWTFQSGSHILAYIKAKTQDWTGTVQIGSGYTGYVPSGSYFSEIIYYSSSSDVDGINNNMYNYWKA